MRDEIERLRAALIAAMEIVLRERVFLVGAVGNLRPPAINYAPLVAALADCDRVIAQADAALK